MPQNKQNTPLNNATWPLIKRLWREYMRHYLHYYVGAIFCLAALAASNAVIINQVPDIIDDILHQGDAQKAIAVAAIIFFTLIMRGIATFGQAILLNSVALQIIRSLQNQMFATLTAVDMVFLQKKGTAAQISRFTNDVHILSTATGRLVTSFGKEFILLIAMISTMFFYNAPMASAILIIFPIILIPVILIAKKIRKLSYTIQQRLGDTTAMLDDSLKSAMQVRAYNLEEQQRHRLGQLFHKFYSLSLRVQILQNLIYPILDTLGGAIFAAILLWGTHTVIGGDMTAGQFITFFIAMFASYTPLRSLSGLYAAVQGGLAAATRIFSLLDYKPEITTSEIAKPLTIKNATIAFKNVSFAYDDETPDILHNINLTFQGGKRNALVGYSGSGKTSLLQLIPRFFDTKTGTISIDNQDIRHVNITSLRNNIAIVFQNAPLFNSSIGNNITLGQEVSEQRLQEICRLALLTDFIAELPDGIDTSVGELGGSVSGGQRQRIAIARALLKEAPILLLDEATSALDQAHERQLHEALEQLMQNRTVIIIAHRLATVQSADTIHLLKDGRIVGAGTHNELLKESDYYRKLCDSDLSE